VLAIALATICQSDPPLQRVDDVARQVHIATSTLEVKWRAAFPARELSLHRFVMWVRLLWTVEQIVAGNKAAAVAARLGIDLSTLTRTATTLTGETLAACVKRGASALFATILRIHGLSE
jgi:hypothetical protein